MELQFGNVAIYQRNHFKAGLSFRKGKKVILLSNDPKDVALGFEEKEPMKFSKTVDFEQIQGAYEFETFGLYNGHKVFLFALQDGKYRALVEGQSLAAKLGFVLYEPGTYERFLAIEDLEKVWEERKPIWGFTELP